MAERLEGVRLGLVPAAKAIVWIFFILRSCSSFENCCKEAYRISATSCAAFFCLATLLSVFILSSSHGAARLKLQYAPPPLP
jgi:hypothetical protein